MAILRRFLRHQSGSSFESLALALSVLAVFCVAGADLLHYASKKDGVLTRFIADMQMQLAQASGQNLRGGIDYMPTGSILGLRRAAGVNPCTAPSK